MTAHSKIVEISRSQGDANIAEAAESGSVAFQDEQGSAPDIANYGEEEWQDEPVNRRPWGKIALLTLLTVTALGWTGFFIWSHFVEIIALPTPVRASELIIGWSVPAALIAVLWLLAMRLSSTEAQRFGDVAALLRTESETLETRMRNVNGEIALARSFLAENARELESIGRLSAQRLTEAAEQLSTALSDSDERAKMLQTASNAAVSNVEQLRNHLPVVTSAAKDATNQIGIAGNTAHSQIQSIITALAIMDEKAALAGEHLDTLDSNISSSANSLETRLSASSEKLASSVQDSESRASALLAQMTDSVENVEQRITEIAAKIDARVSDSHQRLAGNLDELGTSIAHLEAVTDAQDASSSALVGRIKSSIIDCKSQLAAFNDDATDQIAKLAFAVSALSGKSGELGENLTATQVQTDGLIAKVGEMQSGLASITNETSETLAENLGQIEARFAATRSAFESVRNELQAADMGSNALLSSIASLENLVASQRSAIEELLGSSSEHFATQQEQVDALSTAITHTRAVLEDLSGVANDQLVSSLLRVRETTKQAADNSRKIVEGELAHIADKLIEQNRLAIESAVDSQVKVLDGAMREALDRNLTLAADVEEKIAAQMRLVDDMASNLEQRVSTAHASFGGLDDEGFARRMALLTESLNSAAIDVAKILSNEVTDTSWAAYLKGDRGVFTRRAVRLLDSGEARIIAAHYDDDAEFRDHVNRYIHDFEAMMRVLLSTRDGNAIGVTLLSSDVGKLYVALAQAIERLRS
jgi:hypothetical protein